MLSSSNNGLLVLDPLIDDLIRLSFTAVSDRSRFVDDLYSDKLISSPSSITFNNILLLLSFCRSYCYCSILGILKLEFTINEPTDAGDTLDRVRRRDSLLTPSN